MENHAKQQLDRVLVDGVQRGDVRAAAMQLVEQGRLGLDTPAAEICPDLAQAQILQLFYDFETAVYQAHCP